MALDPERVANSLQVLFNQSLVGNWDPRGRVAIQIEERARARATSPDSFVDWLIHRSFIRLAPGITVDVFEQRLREELSTSEMPNR